MKFDFKFSKENVEFLDTLVHKGHNSELKIFKSIKYLSEISNN